MEKTIRVMTRSFRLLTEINQYESLQITRSWHGIGSIDLRINRHLKGADELRRGRIIFPHNNFNKAYVIRHREIELDENGKESEMWNIHALPLKSWLSQRASIPPQGISQDMITANAETVLRHYVDTNVINPIDVDNKLNVILQANQNRGDIIEWQSRYKVLSDEISEISLLSGLGWNIDVDYHGGNYVFNVLEGRNLSVTQSENPPAIFSPEFGTLRTLAYTESDLDYKNYAIVAGQGEGAERRIVEVGYPSAVGFDRHVLFVDARDVGEETEDDPPQPLSVAEIEARLRTRGLQKLAEHGQEIYLEGQALSSSRLVYEEDYDLGDIVTLQNKDWGVSLDERITEIKEIYEAGNPPRIELTFGNNIPTIFDDIKRDISRVDSEITR